MDRRKFLKGLAVVAAPLFIPAHRLDLGVPRTNLAAPRPLPPSMFLTEGGLLRLDPDAPVTVAELRWVPDAPLPDLNRYVDSLDDLPQVSFDINFQPPYTTKLDGILVPGDINLGLLHREEFAPINLGPQDALHVTYTLNLTDDPGVDAQAVTSFRSWAERMGRGEVVDGILRPAED